MALLVQCHQCGKILELDDGFRGGVCRCNLCGALLRVPMVKGREVQKSRPAEPGSAAASPNAPEAPAPNAAQISAEATAHSGRPQTPDGSSPQRPARPDTPDASQPRTTSPIRPARPESPLVESLMQRPSTPGKADPMDSGSSRSDLRRPAAPASPAASRRVQPHRGQPTGGPRQDSQPAQRQRHAGDSHRAIAKKPPVWMYIGSAAGVVLLAVVGVILLGHHPAGAPAKTSGSASGNARHASSAAANYLGIPIDASHVLFSFDGSSANAQSFNLLVALAKKAIATLPPATKIKIALWRPSGLKVYPVKGWLIPRNTRPAIKSMLGYSPYGSTSIRRAMLASLTLGAHQVIFTTQKIIVPSDLAATVLAKRAANQQIDVISVNGERHQLQKLSKATGGQFRMISLGHLQSALGAN